MGGRCWGPTQGASSFGSAGYVPATRRRRTVTSLHTKLFRETGAWRQSQRTPVFGVAASVNGAFLPLHPGFASAALASGNALLCELGRGRLAKGQVNEHGLTSHPHATLRSPVRSVCSSTARGTLTGIADLTRSERDVDVPPPPPHLGGGAPIYLVAPGAPSGFFLSLTPHI